ncbi:AAA family ATPase [Pendulispora albinea]|uniref:AAA family ATPase n=1 Tax=Pendulispora albinea TaxID=2741071 RepID=A0ABZ2MC27_9BACT
MPNLLRLSRKTAPAGRGASARFPFDVPAIATLTTLDLRADVTFFVGENGSGKSTLLEGIACVAELETIGEHDAASDATLTAQRELAADLRLAWGRRSRQGFFLRAEDFFGYVRGQARTDARIVREQREAMGIAAPAEGPEDTLGARHVDERDAAGYLGRYDARSHGESFLDLFSERVRPGGLYLLDEPETPLSPKRQLAFLALVRKAARAGAQFIIATHSPILLACPGARIFSFDESPIAEASYDALDHVSVTRDFLNHPAKYLDDM